MSTEIVPLYRFWQPRYWPLWCGIVLLRLIILLPQFARMSVGRFLGRLVMRVAGDRRQVASRNLELCFPELDDAARNDLVRKHFESIGMGIIELGMAWWCSDAYMDSIVTLNGLEHLHTALGKGHGVLMLSGHFATTEVSGRPMKTRLPPMAAMYRPSNNRLTDQIMRRCRGRSTAVLIGKTGIRQLLKVLKANQPVWYAADQAYNRKGTVLVPFFNEPATTNTAISQISKISKAPVVPFFPFRIDNGKRYTIDILPALENFPSGDDAADALRINQILEQQIRKAPEQYYWVHRRFKGRPEGYPDPYT
jgi:KDO2-lipid IV(A) lauroyltransferase